MIWLQGIVVRLDVGPLRTLFGAIYALGVRLVLRSLARAPAIHSVYGCGSFFEGGCLHGHSDVDLIIVLQPEVKRTHGDHGDVIRRYERIRRFFPFLGRWDEKAGSLIFLEELETGLPLLESFLVRWKQGRLVRLHGPAPPFPAPTGAPTSAEVVSELNTLVQVAACTRGEQTERLLFWRRLFGKLRDLTRAVGVEEALPAETEDVLLNGDDRQSFFLPVDPTATFELFLRSATLALEALGKRDARVRIDVLAAASDQTDEPARFPERLRSLVFASGVEEAGLRALHSLPLGLRFGLAYFPLDEPMPVVELSGSVLVGLRRLTRALAVHGEEDDALLAVGGGFAFVISRQPAYVELVPLDSLAFADVHARLRGQASCEMPASIHAQERERAECQLRAMRCNYERHEGWIPKAPFPCVYREEDGAVVDEAIELLRRHAVLRAGLRFHSGRALLAWWRERQPGCAAFFDAVEESRAYAHGRRGERPAANALYPALHGFMRQALSDAESIRVAPLEQHLPITVAIVTRNRASDLRHALHSIAAQSRPPDEVLVVDNGSSDHTAELVEGFSDRLPLRYLFLAEPGIPGARNLALEEAAGEIVAFTDDDAACDPHWLRSVERAFLRADNVGLVGGWVQHWPAERPTLVDAYYEVFHSHKS